MATPPPPDPPGAGSLPSPGGDAYSFEPFLERLDDDWYGEDALLERLLRRHVGGSLDAVAAELRAWGRQCAGPLRDLARESARPANRPWLESHDARGNRVDRIHLPRSTRRALGVVQGEAGLGSVSGDPFVHYAKVYLYAQNGEAGVACSTACTEGLVRVLEALGDREPHRAALEAVRGTTPERVVHGAQFVTEIQGGSDVPANRTRAVPVHRADGPFRIHGQKWFCSNVNADWFVVTARPEGGPEGAKGIALFLVPARIDALDGAVGGGGEAAARLREAGPGRRGGAAVAPRNGHTVDRLKEKLGTRELATAEVTFRGAVGWPIGPLDRGLPTLLRHVLVPSRFACVLFAASALRRAERIAVAYTGFREAFGRPIAEYPRVARVRQEISLARARSLAAAFRLLALWEEARSLEGWDDPNARPEAEHAAAADFRVLLSLCKRTLTRRASELLHEAMGLLGGNGIEEAFSPLPRLFRDMVIMETWEGPHDVLLAQALRDIGRYGVEPGGFVERMVADEAAAGVAGSDDRRAGRAGGRRRVAGPRSGECPRGEPDGLAARLRRLLAGETDEPPEVVFGPLADDLVAAFADAGLAAAGERGR